MCGGAGSDSDLVRSLGRGERALRKEGEEVRAGKQGGVGGEQNQEKQSRALEGDARWGWRALNPVNEIAFQIPRRCWMGLPTFMDIFFFVSLCMCIFPPGKSMLPLGLFSKRAQNLINWNSYSFSQSLHNFKSSL